MRATRRSWCRNGAEEISFGRSERCNPRDRGKCPRESAGRRGGCGVLNMGGRKGVRGVNPLLAGRGNSAMLKNTGEFGYRLRIAGLSGVGGVWTAKREGGTMRKWGPTVRRRGKGRAGSDAGGEKNVEICYRRARPLVSLGGGKARKMEEVHVVEGLNVKLLCGEISKKAKRHWEPKGSDKEVAPGITPQKRLKTKGRPKGETLAHRKKIPKKGKGQTFQLILRKRRNQKVKKI